LNFPGILTEQDSPLYLSGLHREYFSQRFRS
jgi:hypothetical protein